MASKKNRLPKIAIGFVGWAVALWIFFPLFWMVLTGFKSEMDAISTPPHLIFHPTLQSYHDVFAQENYWHFTFNTVFMSVLATGCALLLGVPAAYSMAFYPGKRTRGTLLWMLSTRMLPLSGCLCRSISSPNRRIFSIRLSVWP